LNTRCTARNLLLMAGETTQDGTASQSDRTLQWGPLKATQRGNDIILESNWDDPAKHAEFIAQWIASRPQIKAGIDDRIKRVKEIIAAHDPIELLTWAGIKWGFTKIRHSGEVEPAEDFIAEYVLGMCSAIPFDTVRSAPKRETIDELGDLLRSLFTEVSVYYGIELAGSDTNRRPLIDLRVQALLKLLYQRGDTHRYYQYDFIKSLYAAHDSFFRQNFGAGVEEMVKEIKNVVISASTTFESQREALGRVFQATEIVAKAVTDGTISGIESLEDLRQKARDLPEVKSVLPDFSSVAETLQQNPFEVVIQSEAQRKIAERLSIAFGENRGFAEFERSPGWPTNAGLHTTRPLIKHGEKYYAFAPQMIWRNLKEIIDGWIEGTDSSYFNTVVLHPKNESGRSRWLEREAATLLKRLLPDAKICQNVFYHQRLETGDTKRREIDALVEYDHNVLIVSAKSGDLSLPARRGAPRSMPEDISRLVVEGFEQGLSAKRHIETEECAIFTDENGVPQITFDAKHRPRAIYVVNVTLAALGPISIQLNGLKNAGLISGNELPWSVFVNDLRVIADILDGPSEFLFYLQRRLRFNQFEQLRGAEELDLFMYFLDQGLFFDEKKLKGVSVLTIGPNTDNLDRYLDQLEHTATAPAKPALATSKDFRALIRAIESTRCDGFSAITLYLLNLDGIYHDQIGENIAALRQKATQDGTCHHAMIAVGQDVGMTIELRPLDMDGAKNLLNYSVLKKYQLKVSTWLFASLAVDLIPNRFDKAAIFTGEWQFDPTLDAVLKRFRTHKLQKATADGRKIGRNEQCPCGSGLKYKACCRIPSKR
jgi:SEC-C motif